MLTVVDNERLVRVGPDAPMGQLFRRFWSPIMLAEEVGPAGSPPVRVRVLGEDLVAFRDSAGCIGLVDAYCPHRRADLFWGRNEGGGLRCVYHGWKFDVGGQCVDLPNAPEGERLKKNIQIASYPTLSLGSMIWAYLGPKEHQPEPPACEIYSVPPSHVHIQKIIVDGNWLQLTEGDVDSSHVSFLHSNTDGTTLEGSRLKNVLFEDRAPKWFVQETAYGLALAARRNAGPEAYSWRVNQWLMPYATLVAGPLGGPILSQTRCPIDDTHTMLFRIFAHPSRPLTDEERRAATNGVIFPEMIPGTFTTAENASNNYNIDRYAQETRSFTGIRSIIAQDLAVTQKQGGLEIADRSRERLVSSDVAIVNLRRRLLTAVRALEENTEPLEAYNASAYRVRPIDVVLPRDQSVFEETSGYLAANV